MVAAALCSPAIKDLERSAVVAGQGLWWRGWDAVGVQPCSHSPFLPRPSLPQLAPCSLDHCAEAPVGLASGKAALRLFVLVGGAALGLGLVALETRGVWEGVVEKGQAAYTSQTLPVLG